MAPPEPGDDDCRAAAHEGFLPPKAGARRQRLQALLASTAASVFFEVPHRIEATLEALAELDAGRHIMIGREITKQFEEFLSGTAETVLSSLRERSALRGEFVCILGPAAKAVGESADAERVLTLLANELGPARAAKLTAQICGGRRSDYYDRAVALSGD